MALMSLMTHPKFFLLVRLLAKSSAIVGPPRIYAIGALEALWHSAYHKASDEIGTADLIEATVDWPGKPGEFVQAMLDAGFLDGDLDGLRVHDLYANAPDYVRKRLQRKRRLKAARGAAPFGAVRRRAAKNGSINKARQGKAPAP